MYSDCHYIVDSLLNPNSVPVNKSDEDLKALSKKAWLHVHPDQVVTQGMKDEEKKERLAFAQRFNELRTELWPNK